MGRSCGAVVVSRSRMVLLAFALACVVGFAGAQSGKHATAYWADYDAKEHNWDMNAVNVYCNQWCADKPFEWRSKYNWTSFCGNPGPRDKEACGKCLKVTNEVHPQSQITVRIVDDCTNESLDLDKPAFNQLDYDGSGYRTGHIFVNYEFVDCLDPAIRLYSE